MATKAELEKELKTLGVETKGLTTHKALAAALKKKQAEIAAESNEEENSKEEEADKKTITVEEPGANPDADASKDKTKEGSDDDSNEDESEEEEEAEEEIPVYKDDRDRKWRFKDSAPKTINIDGHPMTQKEIIENEEVIAELVYGRNNFLTQILE